MFLRLLGTGCAYCVALALELPCISRRRYAIVSLPERGRAGGFSGCPDAGCRGNTRQCRGEDWRCHGPPQLLVRSGMKLEAVLPLLARDLDRARLLDRSIERYLPQLERCWVVVRSAERRAIGRVLSHPRYRLISETDIAPECRYYPKQSGWIKQQVLKLAMAEWVTTPFYLTLDADVVCLRRIQDDELVRGSRGRGVTHQMIHPEWYEAAAWHLNQPVVADEYAVTPAVLHTETVRALTQHLTRRAGSRAPGWRRILYRLSRHVSCLPVLGRSLMAWRLYLLRHEDWTEYSLYYTFAQATRAYERHHFQRPELLISLRSLWFEQEIPGWTPLGGNDPSPFLVAQSATGIAPTAVWQALEPVLGPEPDRILPV